MLGTLVKERQRTQDCCRRTRPGTQMAQIPSNIQNFLEIPEEAGTWLHFSQNTDDQDLLWNVCEVFRNCRCRRTQPVRASQTGPTAASVCTWQRDLLRLFLSQSWLDKVVDGAHIRNTEACWVEPWLFLWLFCRERPQTERSAAPWRPLVDHSRKGRTLSETKRLEF